MPELKFIFHGNGWKRFFLQEFKKLPANCEFHSFRITKHAEFMRQASVYLSLSKIEGGPYPTLEALASGTPTVATNTGWNSELIDVHNGFLVEDYTTDSQIVKYITQCIDIKKSVFNLNLLPNHLTWQTLGYLIYN
jgi:glycosyltransferase involved in cell wall biosynthesis